MEAGDEITGCICGSQSLRGLICIAACEESILDKMSVRMWSLSKAVKVISLL